MGCADAHPRKTQDAAVQGGTGRTAKNGDKQDKRDGQDEQDKWDKQDRRDERDNQPPAFISSIASFVIRISSFVIGGISRSASPLFSWREAPARLMSKPVGFEGFLEFGHGDIGESGSSCRRAVLGLQHVVAVSIEKGGIWGVFG